MPLLRSVATAMVVAAVAEVVQPFAVAAPLAFALAAPLELVAHYPSIALVAPLGLAAPTNRPALELL